MKDDSRYDTRTSFIDMLLSSMITLFFIFLLNMFFINVNKAVTEAPKINAEFILDIAWQSGIDCDVDIWIKTPTGKSMWFKNKTSGMVNLERDDTGMVNDTTTDANGNKVTNPLNRETVIFRGNVAGEYVVNLHLYRSNTIDCKPLLEAKGLPVDLVFSKLNPSLKVIKEEKIVMTKEYEEVTAFRFLSDASGNITKIWKEPTSLIEAQPMFPLESVTP